MKKLSALLLVFCMLFSFAGCKREGVEPPNNSAVIPSGSPQTAEPTVSPSPDETPTPTPSESPDDGNEPLDKTKTISASINGSTKQLEASLYTGELRSSDPAVSFLIYYDDEGFEVSFNSNAYRFTSSDGSAFMEISLINSAVSDDLMPSFADSYIDFTDIEFSSFSALGADKLKADLICAYNSSEYFEAYLSDVSDGVAAVAISAPSNTSSAFLWLKAMLETFELT